MVPPLTSAAAAPRRPSHAPAPAMRHRQPFPMAVEVWRVPTTTSDVGNVTQDRGGGGEGGEAGGWADTHWSGGGGGGGCSSFDFIVLMRVWAGLWRANLRNGVHQLPDAVLDGLKLLLQGLHDDPHALRLHHAPHGHVRRLLPHGLRLLPQEPDNLVRVKTEAVAQHVLGHVDDGGPEGVLEHLGDVDGQAVDNGRDAAVEDVARGAPGQRQHVLEAGEGLLHEGHDPLEEGGQAVQHAGVDGGLVHRVAEDALDLEGEVGPDAIDEGEHRVGLLGRRMRGGWGDGSEEDRSGGIPVWGGGGGIKAV